MMRIGDGKEQCRCSRMLGNANSSTVIGCGIGWDHEAVQVFRGVGFTVTVLNVCQFCFLVLLFSPFFLYTGAEQQNDRKR